MSGSRKELSWGHFKTKFFSENFLDTPTLEMVQILVQRRLRRRPCQNYTVKVHLVPTRNRLSIQNLKFITKKLHNLQSKSLPALITSESIFVVYDVIGRFLSFDVIRRPLDDVIYFVQFITSMLKQIYYHFYRFNALGR